jgi:hypothetical protein
MTVLTRKGEKKIPVEELQEQHLAGPADEPMEVVAAELKENQVVVVDKVPHIEKITFRNQRDPGHELQFHYASKTHPFKQYTLIDGYQYDLPVEVIKNLEGCRENIEKYRKGTSGLPEIYIAGYRTHFVCERV